MNLWAKYVSVVYKNCLQAKTLEDGLLYWKDLLFSFTIIYFGPFCLFTLSMGIWMTVQSNNALLSIINILGSISLLVIAFAPGISVFIRKIIFITIYYALSFFLFVYFGNLGLVLLYLFVPSVLAMLIFHRGVMFWSLGITTVICLLILISIYSNYWNFEPVTELSLFYWIVFLSNLIYLNGIFAFMLPKLFNGLQNSVDKQKELSRQLDAERSSLVQSMNLVKRKNEEIELFAYNAANNMKSPIRLIQTYLRRIIEKYGGELDEKGRIFTNMAKEGIEKLRSNMIGLLIYSKLGKWTEDPELIDLNELIEDIWEEIKTKNKDHKASLVLDTLPQIYTYQSVIKIVLEQLINNTFIHGNEDKMCMVEIKTEKLNKHWQFSIKDNGRGIPQSSLERIFDVFHKLDNNPSGSGIGMGLTITRKIIEQMNGEIWVESELGKGSTFYFTIPVLEKIKAKSSIGSIT